MITEEDLVPGQFFIREDSASLSYFWGAICFKRGYVRWYNTNFMKNGEDKSVTNCKGWGVNVCKQEDIDINILLQMKEDFPHLFRREKCETCGR